MSSQARILLLCDDRRGHANTVLDHIAAFGRFSKHQVRTFNPKAMTQSVALDLEEFDAVAIHYSVVLSDPIYISPDLLAKLKRFGGLKIQFIQDDYRWVDRATTAAREAGITVLFTVVPEPAAAKLYDERLPGVRRIQTLTGYVPEALLDRPIRPLDDRKIDVGYRARDLPFWYGALSREKASIGRRFLELAPEYGLKCDIALGEHDRIYGHRWVEFVSSCRATLGTESGASIADFDGSAERGVRSYLREHPAATYEEVHEAVLRPFEGNVIASVISPRVFEAASLRTAMILFPGYYSGVIEAGRHYIVLNKDFSNLAEVVAKLRDDSFINAMTARTHGDLIKSGRWSYKSFIAEFDQVIDEEATTMRGPARAPRWQLARVERALRVPGPRVRLLRGVHAAWTRVFRSDRSMGFAIEYESQIEKAWFALRIVITEPELRSLLRLGRRAGVPLDRLLREIMELSLLRKAAGGRLSHGQSFTLKAAFNSGLNSLCFVSTPRGQDITVGESASVALRDAIRAGELRVIEWDHRAMGGKIHIERPAMTVGIGYEGLESFTVVAALGQMNPSVLERALEPAIAGAGHGRASANSDHRVTSPGA